MQSNIRHVSRINTKINSAIDNVKVNFTQDEYNKIARSNTVPDRQRFAQSSQSVTV
jgi:hypothetical protein